MIISELIKELECLKKEFGNLKVTAREEENWNILSTVPIVAGDRQVYSDIVWKK